MEDFKEKALIVKPFLRWAGGKRWLVKYLKNLKIESYRAYHEPFVGGGAILFHLRPKCAYISDVNADLIKTYQALKDNPEEVKFFLKSYIKDKEFYYQIRGTKFENEYEEAAKFIYLNQMSFNGIYRVNKSGEYNVPFGNRITFNFDYNNITSISDYLKQVKIKCGDFETVLANVKKGDFVFLDPPYTIAHNNNGFVQYNQKIFSIEDQYRLSKLIDKIKEAGAFYLLTNAAHFKVREIFDKNDRIIEVDRSSVVGGKNAVRGVFTEFLFTNINEI